MGSHWSREKWEEEGQTERDCSSFFVGIIFILKAFLFSFPGTDQALPIVLLLMFLGLDLFGGTQPPISVSPNFFCSEPDGIPVRKGR